MQTLQARHPMSVAVVTAFGILLACPAWAQTLSDPVQGKATAERWCNTCHVVASGGRGSDVAPNFAAIARNRDDAYLRGFLTNPHPPMPRFELSRQDIEDLISYFSALRRS